LARVKTTAGAIPGICGTKVRAFSPVFAMGRRRRLPELRADPGHMPGTEEDQLMPGTKRRTPFAVALRAFTVTASGRGAERHRVT